MVCPCRTRKNRVSGSWLGRVCRFAHVGVCLLVLFVLQACHKASLPAPATTIILIDQARSSWDYQRRLDEELAEFTRQTGIRVEFLPAPETAEQQLAIWQRLLEGGPKAPDLYSVDVIWPTILAENLLDLKPYIPEQEIQAHFPELISNYTVNGRLVALPANLSEGMLFYRVDLLRKYRYRAPPKTWQTVSCIRSSIGCKHFRDYPG
jgi:trehalose/maltose transport system substrate-binding protein